MRALICGSMAFDTIMVFKGHFRSQILPDQLHMLNVSFLVPELRREYGGCAGNIAYNVRLLGDAGVPMATVGPDAESYLARMQEQGIATDFIRVVEGEYTAQGFVTTDLDDNQIWAFHPGAMQQSHLNKVTDAKDIALGIVAPDGREGMLQHAQQFRRTGIPFIFDPGQGLPMFDGPELRQFVDQATWVAMNDYEWHMLQERTGFSVANVTERVQAVIVTRGAEGSTIYRAEGTEVIPPAVPQAVVDPTGCGDAYRAGIIHGLLHGLSWPVTGRVASLMGALKIEVRGTQNHRFTMSEFRTRYLQSFGEPLAHAGAV